jgi:hypothetical protein
MAPSSRPEGRKGVPIFQSPLKSRPAQNLYFFPPLQNVSVRPTSNVGTLLTPAITYTEPCTSGRGIRAPPPDRARAHGGPKAVSFTIRARSRATWPCRTPATPTRPWASGVIRSGSSSGNARTSPGPSKKPRHWRGFSCEGWTR